MRGKAKAKAFEGGLLRGTVGRAERRRAGGVFRDVRMTAERRSGRARAPNERTRQAAQTMWLPQGRLHLWLNKTVLSGPGRQKGIAAWCAAVPFVPAVNAASVQGRAAFSLP